MKRLLLLFTLILSGRAMTLAFISSIGRGEIGDPPLAWAMPLIGDAVIGVSALFVLFLLVTRPTNNTFVAAIVWNSIGIWDALSAYVVSRTNPWPEFFMLKLFGSTMFFVAILIHGFNIWILIQQFKYFEIRRERT